MSTLGNRAGIRTKDGVDEVLSGYAGLQATQEAFYKDLHAHPELSHHEHRTAGRVAAELEKYGLTVQAGIGGTGVVGQLGNGDGPTVLLRAELDALPIAEDTGADYASTVTTTGADGRQVPVAHACGHDMHMACLLAAVRLLADHRDRWNGTLLALFQPAEETGDGAQGMVADGLFTRIPAPDVALSQHLLPGIAGTVGTCPGPFMSAEDGIAITVYGRGGHGALPQNTVDPVVLAAMIIVRLQTVVSRELTPGDTAIVTVGAVQAGARGNVIPDHAVLQLNMRSYSEPTRQRMLDAIRRIVRGECQASGSPREPSSRPSPASRCSTTTPPPPTRWRPRSPPTSGKTRTTSRSRRSARTSGSSPPPRAPRTRTGESGEPTGRPTSRPRRRGGCGTCRPTTRPGSCRRSSPPSAPAPRPW